MQWEQIFNDYYTVSGLKTTLVLKISCYESVKIKIEYFEIYRQG
jgi:hypothetical protein